MTGSMADARAAYNHISNAKKTRAGLHHPQHKGRTVVPVWPTTTLREIREAVPADDVVVLATVLSGGGTGGTGGDPVEYGLYSLRSGPAESVTDGPAGEPDTPDELPGGDVTVQQLIAEATAGGNYPAPLPPGLRVD